MFPAEGEYAGVSITSKLDVRQNQPLELHLLTVQYYAPNVVQLNALTYGLPVFTALF